MNRYCYHYNIESSYTSRCTTKRGLNGVDRADLQLDVENVKFNTGVMRVLDNVRREHKLSKKPFDISTVEYVVSCHTKAIDEKKLYEEVMENLNQSKKIKNTKQMSEIMGENGSLFHLWWAFNSTRFSVHHHVCTLLKTKSKFLLKSLNCTINIY